MFVEFFLQRNSHKSSFFLMVCQPTSANLMEIQGDLVFFQNSGLNYVDLDRVDTVAGDIIIQENYKNFLDPVIPQFTMDGYVKQIIQHQFS